MYARVYEMSSQKTRSPRDLWPRGFRIDRANGAHPRVSLQLESRINFLLTSTSPNSSLKQESEINSWLISAKFVKNSSLQLYTIFINANTMNN